ncbi:Uncharacterized protein Rs2_28666 [Raphanus sativus]|nr:Uncharacterized protein Rs2_28666 [Raphanus sativus]
MWSRAGFSVEFSITRCDAFRESYVSCCASCPCPKLRQVWHCALSKFCCILCVALAVLGACLYRQRLTVARASVSRSVAKAESLSHSRDSLVAWLRSSSSRAPGRMPSASVDACLEPLWIKLALAKCGCS